MGICHKHKIQQCRHVCQHVTWCQEALQQCILAKAIKPTSAGCRIRILRAICKATGLGPRADWGLEDGGHRMGAVGVPGHYARGQHHLPLPAAAHFPAAPSARHEVQAALATLLQNGQRQAKKTVEVVQVH